jgi:hypothetical protein
MRLTTLVLVLLLALATVATFANGIGPTPPAEEEVTPTPTTPEGAGPTMPETQPVVPSMNVGPTTPVCPQPTSDVEVFNTNFVSTTFGIDCPSLTGLRQAGWAWGDIYILANIANKTGRPILEIANLRSQGMAYDQIACRYNLAASDILMPTPPMIQTRVAGFTGEYGYMPLYYKTDPWGNPVLTRFDAERLTRMGYAWTSIASAANVSAVTGMRVEDVLLWIDRGYTWTQISSMYGVDCDYVTVIDQYPFARESGFGICPTGAPCPAPVGAGPCNTCPVCQRANGPCGACPPTAPCNIGVPAGPVGPVTTYPMGTGPSPCDTCPTCQTGNGPCNVCPPTAPCNMGTPVQPTGPVY